MLGVKALPVTVEVVIKASIKVSSRATVAKGRAQDMYALSRWHFYKGTQRGRWYEMLGWVD
jgi:hypothetical protein